MLAAGFVWDTSVVPVGQQASQTSHRTVNLNQLYTMEILYTKHKSFKESLKLYTQKRVHKQTVSSRVQTDLSRQLFQP